ncbi:MAG: hypothetical protein ABSE73_01235 [Planctomycetota bacterium]
MSSQRLCLVLMVLSALLFCPPRLWAGGEEKAYRQFPEFPDVLYYEGFETSAKTWKKGTLEDKIIQGPANPHSLKLEQEDANEKRSAAILEPPLKVPGGLEPNEIYVQFMVYVDEPGELQVMFKDGDFDDKPRLPKTKAWVPVTLRMHDFSHGGKERIKKEHSFSAIHLYFRPKDRTKWASVYIDDFVITYRTPPTPALLYQVMQSMSKQSLLIRSLEREGFTFNPQIQDAMKSMLKSVKKVRKPKTVLVVGAQPQDTEELVKGLKLKAADFTFLGASAPDGTPLGGLEDMRTLLPYNTIKNEPGMALLMLSYADTVRPGRPGDGVRALLERTLEAGCVPILCLPPSHDGLNGDEKGKLNGFINNVSNTCTALGLPLLDEGFGLKEVKNAFNGKDLAAPGMEKFTELATTTIKHLDMLVFGKK